MNDFIYVDGIETYVNDEPEDPNPGIVLDNRKRTKALSSKEARQLAEELVNRADYFDTISAPEALKERTYCVGLPVVVTVADGDDAHHPFVAVEVDLSELGTSVRKDEFADETISDEQIEKDATLLERWTDVHSVKNEGFAPYLPEGS